MHDDILKAVGRGHTAAAIKELYAYVRSYTNFAVNMDFIAGLPYQTLSHMEENLDYVCQARPENVTIHTLALKRGSPLYDGVGREAMPEAAAVEEMVARSKERLEAAGYVPYYVYRQQYMTSQTENIAILCRGIFVNIIFGLWKNGRAYYPLVRVAPLNGCALRNIGNYNSICLKMCPFILIPYQHCLKSAVDYAKSFGRDKIWEFKSLEVHKTYYLM